MRKSIAYGMMATYGLLLAASPAGAITPTGFMPGVENTVANAYNSVVGVWIPAISFAALFGLVLNCFFAWVRIAIKVVGLLFGIFGLGAGLPWLASISGGTIATSFVLHLH
jgi:hypothetical protein